jgi:adenylate cyclase class IV
MLEILGFSAWLEMKKRRISYELTSAHVEIDCYEGDFGFIPEFLEIEGRDIRSVYLAAEALGFRKEDCKPWDAVELASFYRERNRLPGTAV